MIHASERVYERNRSDEGIKTITNNGVAAVTSAILTRPLEFIEYKNGDFASLTATLSNLEDRVMA